MDQNRPIKKQKQQISADIPRTVSGPSGTFRSQNPNRKPKEKFGFGNYSRYYHYRDTQQRLSSLDPKLFEDKICLDIGCNVGSLTMEIAFHFSVQEMVGIDIDEALIPIAKQAYDRKREELDPVWPLSVVKSMETVVPKTYVPKMSFEACNVIHYQDSRTYDVITCFSTSKWIHLNFGDEGIKATFGKVHQLLKDGGHFLLEPALWAAYKKKRSLTEVTKKCFREIKLRPEHFQEYLTKELHFEFIKEIQADTNDFERPILVFRKKQS